MPMRPAQDGWRAAELHEAEQEAIREIAALQVQGVQDFARFLMF
jgi:hypothetical protein